MGHHHLSRRELLNSIPVLVPGSRLIPVGESGQAYSLAMIRGTIRDASTGKPAAAKMRITDAASGQSYMPAECVRSMPQRNDTGVRYFYVRGSYEVALPAGRYEVEVVRGICHAPETQVVEVSEGARTLDVLLGLVADSRRMAMRLTFRPCRCFAPRRAESGARRFGATTAMGWKRRWRSRWGTWMR